MRRAHWLERWVPRVVGLAPLALWFVPASTYDAGRYHEHATFALGWPTTWYESEVRIEAGLIARPPDLVIQKRPLELKGPERVWWVRAGAVEPFPNNLPAFTGWNAAVCKRKVRIHPWYGPVWPTVIGFGVLYVAARINRDRAAKEPRQNRNADPPPAPV